MNGLGPVVADTSASVSTGLPSVSVECRAHLSELARREWFAPGPSWAAELEGFLAGHGLPVRDLAARTGEPAGPVASRGRLTAGSASLRPPAAPADGHAVCGAAVLLSASAGAALVGARAR